MLIICAATIHRNLKEYILHRATKLRSCTGIAAYKFQKIKKRQNVKKKRGESGRQEVEKKQLKVNGSVEEHKKNLIVREPGRLPRSNIMQNRLENAHRKPGLQPLCTVILRRLCLVTERLADTASHCLEQVSLISLGFTATRYRRNGNNTKYCNMCPRSSLHMINNHVRFKIPRLYCSINWISTSRNYPHPRTQLLFVFAFIKLPTRRKSHYCT